MKTCPVCGDYTLSKKLLKHMTYTKPIECPYCKSQISTTYYPLLISALVTIGFQILIKFKFNLITISFAIVFVALLVYFLGKLTPRVEVTNLKRRKVVNVLHTMVLITLSIGLIVSRLNFVERSYIAEDFREIEVILSDLSEDLIAYEEGVISDSDFHVIIDHAFIECATKTRGNTNYQGLRTYLNYSPFEPLEILFKKSSKNPISEENLKALEALIDINKKYAYLGDTSQYALSFNIFKDLEQTKAIKAYIAALKEI